MVIDPYADPNECTCVVCGGHRIACCYPPVCGEDCRFWYEYETAAHLWYKNEMKKIEREPRCVTP